MKFSESVTALPGCCFICRSDNRKWYIDLRIDLEFTGALFVCNECIQEMWNIAPEGLSEKETINGLRKENLALIVEVHFYKEKFSELRDLIDTNSPHGFFDLPATFSQNDVQDSDGDNQGSEPDDREAGEQTSDEELAGVRPSADSILGLAP